MTTEKNVRGRLKSFLDYNGPSDCDRIKVSLYTEDVAYLLVELDEVRNELESYDKSLHKARDRSDGKGGLLDQLIASKECVKNLRDQLSVVRHELKQHQKPSLTNPLYSFTVDRTPAVVMACGGSRIRLPRPCEAYGSSVHIKNDAGDAQSNCIHATCDDHTLIIDTNYASVRLESRDGFWWIDGILKLTGILRTSELRSDTELGELNGCTVPHGCDDYDNSGDCQGCKDPTALTLVLAELQSATAKFGTFNSAHEGYAVLLEEVDELWVEVKEYDSLEQQLEAIQVAAMALRFLRDVCGLTIGDES